MGAYSGIERSDSSWAAHAVYGTDVNWYHGPDRLRSDHADTVCEHQWLVIRDQESVKTLPLCKVTSTYASPDQTRRWQLHQEQSMDMWTRPTDQLSPYGTYGQAMDNTKTLSTP